MKETDQELELQLAGLAAEKAALQSDRDWLKADLEHTQTSLSSRVKELETMTELLDKMDREYRDLQSKFLNTHASPGGQGRESRQTESPAAPHTPV